MIEVRPVAWDDPVGARLRADQEAEVATRYGTDDSEPGPKPTAGDVTLFVIAYDDDEPVGCGALRALDGEHGELKRMYVVPERRGTGASVVLLRGLEDAARVRGWDRLVLETGIEQPDAMRFYEREGYTRIPNFGYYAGSAISRCYAKNL